MQVALHSIKNIGKHGKIGLWLIRESVEELLKIKSFSKEDVDQIHSFSNPSRRKEWLVSRILIDELIDMNNTRIYYDEYNKPFLKIPDRHISISHSHELQVVMLDRKPTGVDIEYIQPKIDSIKSKFMSVAELRMLGDENIVEKLTLCWCVKESLYKYYGKKKLVFKEHLTIHPFTYSTEGKITADISTNEFKEQHELRYETISIGEHRFMLTYIVNQV